MSVDQYYEFAMYLQSDINEHIPTLYKYAKECSHITEFGVRSCVSSWGFLKGLVDSSSLKNKKLIGVDLNYDPQIEVVRDVCKQNNIDYTFIQNNDLNIDIEETDILFIDSWHVYGQLIRELDKHHSKVKKYIIMHDTTVDEFVGESIRCGFDIESQHKQTGFTRNEIIVGLWPAVLDFLDSHPEFKILERYTNNNGLTILERIN